MSRYFVGLTGASGHAYARTLIRALVRADCDVDVSITGAGCKVLRHEQGFDAGVEGEKLASVLAPWLGDDIAPRVRAFTGSAVEAPPSSGTSLTGGVIICPCSMGTLARASVGFSSNLVERAVDVALKERRKLILVAREAPYSTLHLENMLRLSRMGAVILPASPGFYHKPKTLDDLVDHVVGKVLDSLGVQHAVGARWKGIPKPDEDRGLDGARLAPPAEDEP